MLSKSYVNHPIPWFLLTIADRRGQSVLDSASALHFREWSSRDSLFDLDKEMDMDMNMDMDMDIEMSLFHDFATQLYSHSLCSQHNPDLPSPQITVKPLEPCTFQKFHLKVSALT
jgi:hypothetical protein